MAGLHLHTDKESSFTKVSNIFIDEYMTTANGDYVKIYLYLLRCMNMSDCHCSVQEMADRFDYTENDINRALKYWEKMHIINLEYDSQGALNGICLIDSAKLTSPKRRSSDSDAQLTPATAKRTSVSTGVVKDTLKASTVKSNYSLEDVERFRQNADVQNILFSTEQYIKKSLGLTDIRTIYYWYDVLGFPADVIEYLVESCVSKGHRSLHYIDKVALAWHENGIKTIEDARKYASTQNKEVFAVMRYFGISGRNLIDSETAFIDKWTKEYAFTLDIIEEACRRTISATQKPSFEYADKILESWHKEGVHHLSDIAKADEQFKKTKATKAAAKTTAKVTKSTANNRFNNFDQRTYDYDELEQLISYKGN